MKLILPLVIRTIPTKTKIPLILVKFGKKGIIKLERFSTKEKEKLFQIDNLKIKGETFTYKLGSAIPSSHRNFILGNYKIIIKEDTDNPAKLQKIQETLDFIFRIINGSYLPIAKFEDTEPIYCGLLTSGHVAVSRRNNLILEKEDIKHISRLLKIMLGENIPTKAETLKFFLNTAMKQVPNIGIAGAFYVTILESLFVPEKSSEINYRLSMRLTKKRKEKLLFAKNIKKLYGKRSGVFHGNNDKFNAVELKFLEETATWAIKDYLNNPKSFDMEELDKYLLS